MKDFVVIIGIMRISTLRLPNQLHSPELGLCQSARLALNVYLHREQGRVNDMNGEAGW